MVNAQLTKCAIHLVFTIHVLLSLLCEQKFRGTVNPKFRIFCTGELPALPLWWPLTESEVSKSLLVVDKVKTKSASIEAHRQLIKLPLTSSMNFAVTHGRSQESTKLFATTTGRCHFTTQLLPPQPVSTVFRGGFKGVGPGGRPH